VFLHLIETAAKFRHLHIEIAPYRKLGWSFAGEYEPTDPECEWPSDEEDEEEELAGEVKDKVRPLSNAIGLLERSRVSVLDDNFR
jgi:hypothetical protein